MDINHNFPDKLAPLFSPGRYKVLWGGRGSAKSWGIARALLLIGMQKGIRVLCAREQQNSIKESVHKLLSDQISALGLGAFYEIQRDIIINPHTGTSFFFEGIRHNVQKIKSYEGIDICWVEEAQTVSKNSWQVLIPTIRKPGSEIWVSFNPDLETDETYVRFVKSPPPNAIVIEMNWRDNPWFPPELREEMEYLKATAYDDYLHVYEGHCKMVLEGAVYANELRAAISEGRLTSVPYDRASSVDTFWDLGWSDHTSIWFAQRIGFETHVVDYLQDRQKNLEWYLGELQVRGYTYGTMWLPHDARAKQLGSGKSIEEIARAKGHKVRIVPRLSLYDGINAARTVFPNCYFDKDACAEGLKALRHYRYEIVANEQEKTFSREPVHDQHSHAADAFRYMAISLKAPSEKKATRLKGLFRGKDFAGDNLAYDFDTNTGRIVPRANRPPSAPSPQAWMGR